MQQTVNGEERKFKMIQLTPHSYTKQNTTLTSVTFTLLLLDYSYKLSQP